MPPRSYRDLTPEELEELDREINAVRSVPQLPLGAQASAGDAWLDELADDPPQSRMEVGPIQMRGQSEDEAWLDDLMANPPQTQRTPMLSTSGPGGTFEGEDTPQSRALIQQRGLGQAPVGDADLLDPSASQRKATLPELDQGDELDELITAESAASGPQGYQQQAAPRRSREDAVSELFTQPSRMQGIAALLGDALYGGNMVDNVQQRGRTVAQARAQARMQDIAAGERAEQQAADREMTDARLGVQLRGQDLADARAEQARKQQLGLAERSDQRIREENALGRDAAMERARVMAEARARGEAPELTPEEETAQLVGFLKLQANVSEDEAKAYVAGNGGGSPEKLERMRAFHSQFKGLSPSQRGTVIGQGLGRAGAQQDKEEPLRLQARNELLEQHLAIKEASEAWAKMSDDDKKVMARVGGGDSWMGSTARSAMLSKAGQPLAAKIQALANTLIKAQSGASVTKGEWSRVATELGLPQEALSPFNTPASIESWLQKSVDAFRKVKASTESTYKGLFDEVEP